MSQKKTQQALVVLAVVPLLLLPLLVGTCSGKKSAPQSQEPVSDILTAGH